MQQFPGSLDIELQAASTLVLRVSNLPPSMVRDKARQMFSVFGPVSALSFSNGVAFVAFVEPAHAAYAKMQLEQLPGHALDVAWAPEDAMGAEDDLREARARTDPEWCLLANVYDVAAERERFGEVWAENMTREMTSFVGGRGGAKVCVPPNGSGGRVFVQFRSAKEAEGFQEAMDRKVLAGRLVRAHIVTDEQVELAMA